jgi:ribonuclease HI
VTGAYVAAHPYEEPAYDLYPVENEVATLGLGRLGVLPAAQPLAAFAADVAAALHLPSLRYSGDGARLVKRVAVLPGSGAEAIVRGVAQVADVLVTGDVKYHEARAAQTQGLALVDAPHGVTEQEAVLRWARTFADALGAGARVETYRNPAVSVWQSPEGVSARAASPPAAPAKAASPARPVNRDDARHHLYTDGGARGNPGPAGIGAVLLTASGDLVEELGDFIGKATNNVAEYQALLAGLEMALDRGVERLDAFLDSELVVRQVNGQYKVKDAGLKPLHAQACQLLSRFHEVSVKHVRREQNAEADRLVNEAIDAAGR